MVVETKGKFDEIQIFLEDDITEEQRDKIETSAKDNEGVLSVLFESKDQALKIFKEEWEDQAYLLEGLEDDNPLPNSFIVKLKDIEYADSVVDSVKELKGVEKVNYYYNYD